MIIKKIPLSSLFSIFLGFSIDIRLRDDFIPLIRCSLRISEMQKTGDSNL